MQALIPLFALVAACCGTELTLLPYAYLADPLPVYHQSQNTQTGEHAYSYAGGPSAKEEVRGLDGVTRGSYSYVDANGILQSVFYVADEGGFRVAATNLPGEDEYATEPVEVILARNAASEDGHSTRRKRSLEDSERNLNQAEERKDSGSKEDSADQQPAESVHSLVYQLPGSVLLPKLVTATSHQSQVQVHNNVQLESAKAESLVKVNAEPVAPSVLLGSEVPLATSHQSQVQVHSNLNVKLSEPEGVVKAKEPVVFGAPLTPIFPLETVPLVAAVPSYHENRIQLHRSIGLEGPNRKDTVKINADPFVVLDTPLTTVPAFRTVATNHPVVSVLPTVYKEAVPLVHPGKIATATVTTSVSSHGVSQIHGDSKLRLAAPLVSEPGFLVRTAVPLLQPLPYATASQARVQVHKE